MKFKSSSSKGFTLIELLVVVAIISLLSSVVLASLKEARLKAQQKAFVVSMNEFINALELYRADNDKYPFENDVDNLSYNYFKRIDGTADSSPEVDLFAPNILGKYLSKAPEPVGKNSSQDASWTYYANSPSVDSPQTFYRCIGDTKIPPYIIVVHNDPNNWRTYESVSGWKDGVEYLSSGSTEWFYESPTFVKCFSLQ